jgi:4-hydroxy-tetrahydrodipicolinate synthase
VSGLPARNVVIAAVPTPVGADYRPDGELLLARCRDLLAEGCDGIALFGTTGEGVAFTVADRREILERVVAGGLDARRLIVSVGALSLPDVMELAAHATRQGVAGVLLMPPCLYRTGIGEDGTFRFYATVIDRVANAALRLHLYHFPDVSGVPVTSGLIRRLSETYGPIIAGVKDSGGDLGFTEDLLRRLSHLAIYTGTELHIPAVLAAGGRGTICGLASVIARLVRAMSDAPTLPDRRRFVPLVQAVDSILSRGPFIPSLKAVIAQATQRPDWRRVTPPMGELPVSDEERLLADFNRVAATFPL